MENQALFLFDQKYRNVREILDIGQMSIVLAADKIVERAAIEGMRQGLHYKEIYRLAKCRIETLAALYGKSVIPGDHTERLALSA